MLYKLRDACDEKEKKKLIPLLCLTGMLTVPIAEVTWPMILVLVSLLSAAIGALFMVVFLHLKL